MPDFLEIRTSDKDSTAASGLLRAAAPPQTTNISVRSSM